MAFSKALYFAAILPPTGIKEEVKKMKLEIKEKFGVAHALKLPAHITLIPPVWMEEEQEKLLFASLEAVTIEHIPFPVELENFGHFGQRAIFINVMDHEPVKQLHLNLLQELREFLPPDNKGTLHPHITLATRDLNRQKFKKVWQEFKDKFYHAEFEATAVTLFKHNGKTWDVLENFPFLNRDNSD